MFVAAGEGADDRHDAVDLLLGRDARRAGPRGFPPDVDDIRAGGGHRVGVANRVDEAHVLAAVGERVGGHVEDAHDERLSPQRHRSGSHLERAVAFGVGHGPILSRTKTPAQVLGPAPG